MCLLNEEKSIKSFEQLMKTLPDKSLDKMINKINNHGGKRTGSGRPKLKKSQKKEPTKVVRVPLSKLSAVIKLIKNDKP